VICVLLAAPMARAAEQTLLGKRLLISDPGAATKRKVICAAKHGNSANALGGDPTVAGAIVEVTANGGTPSEQSFALPQGTGSNGKAFWSGDAVAGYKYSDTRGENGPVRTVKLRNHAGGALRLAVKIAGTNGGLAVVPPNPGTDGCVVLSIVDGDRYSVAFGATASVTTNNAKTLLMKKPTVEAVCPPVPTTVTTTSTSTTTIPGTCPTANFLDVSSAPGAGGGYPAPTLAVSCTDTEVHVQSNGIPHYTFVAITPNGLSEIDQTYRFPRYPAVAATETSLPLLGVIGVTVDGMTLTGPNEAAFPDPYGDPVANAIVDGCSGHTAPGGAYHNHALIQKCLIPSGLVADPWNNPDPTGTARSPVLGYALDGFPIYGPYECTDASCTTIYEALSSWDNIGYESLDCTSSAQCSGTNTCALAMIAGVKRKACIPKTYAWNNNQYSAKAGVAYMDQCNGHVGPNGDYHYHATAAFPYALGCYRGTTL
jgi:hypothetical protein